MGGSGGSSRQRRPSWIGRWRRSRWCRLRRLASTYEGLISPLVCGSSLGFRSVRFSELHGRVLAVCMFCTREPSFSHAAPCALFVSARGTRHAFAFVGLAPKFFRWNHGAPQRREPTNPKTSARQLGSSSIHIKKTWCDAARNWRQSGWKWRLGSCVGL